MTWRRRRVGRVGGQGRRRGPQCQQRRQQGHPPQQPPSARDGAEQSHLVLPASSPDLDRHVAGARDRGLAWGAECRARPCGSRCWRNATRVLPCQYWEVVWNRVGLGPRLLAEHRRAGLLPPDLQPDTAIPDWIQGVAGRYGERLRVRVLNLASTEGLLEDLAPSRQACSCVLQRSPRPGAGGSTPSGSRPASWHARWHTERAETGGEVMPDRVLFLHLFGSSFDTSQQTHERSGLVTALPRAGSGEARATSLPLRTDWPP